MREEGRMNPMDKREIRSIIPATGWVAVYLTEKPPYYDLIDLVCWGVVREYSGDEDAIAGFTGGDFVSIADDDEGFLIYIYAPSITEEDRAYWTRTGEHLAVEKRFAPQLKALKQGMHDAETSGDMGRLAQLQREFAELRKTLLAVPQARGEKTQKSQGNQRS
jgi:hypothetical protein